MKVERIDHIVLTVKDIDTTVNFYTHVMGMQKVLFGKNRIALSFGNQKINLHKFGNEFEPKANHVAAGSADLCFIVKDDIKHIVNYLSKKGVSIIDGPVNRTGATGEIISVYFRDPDGNLIEISNYTDS